MGVEFIAVALLSGVVGAVVGSATAAVAARRAATRVAMARAELVSAATDARLERIEHILTAPDQAWYWTDEWQRGEADADADLAAGRSTVYTSESDFLAALHKIPAADSPTPATH